MERLKLLVMVATSEKLYSKFTGFSDPSLGRSVTVSIVVAEKITFKMEQFVYVISHPISDWGRKFLALYKYKLYYLHGWIGSYMVYLYLEKIPLVFFLLNLRMIIARAVMRIRITVTAIMAITTGTRSLFFFFFFFPWHDSDIQRFGFPPRLEKK